MYTGAFSSWKEELYGVSPVQFWLWIEDSKSNFIFNHQCFRLARNVVGGLSLCIFSSFKICVDIVQAWLTILLNSASVYTSEKLMKLV
jgi:hypothetical protein